jgi:hypothetical protein
MVQDQILEFGHDSLLQKSNQSGIKSINAQHLQNRADSQLVKKAIPDGIKFIVGKWNQKN